MAALRALTWQALLGTYWRHVVLDLHDRRIDVESGILRDRSWRWLQTHIADIAATPGTRTHTAVTAPVKETPDGAT